MLKIVSLFTLAAFGLMTNAAQFDPPDLNLEYRLHRQFLMSKGETPQAQQGLLESYRLQQGESLWGLSQMLYGDGSYWPKVWAQNQSITNPHLIQPGYTLQFLMGSEDDTPAFRFSEAEDGNVEMAAFSVPGNPQIQVPPPELAPRPIIKVPESFPEWQKVYRDKPIRIGTDYTKLTIERAKHIENQPLTAYVQETELESVGSVLEPEKESGLPVAGQYIYVKVKKGVGQVGQRYVIARDYGRIPKLNGQVEGRIIARFIRVYGDLELTHETKPNFRRKSDAEKYDIFRARLDHALDLSRTDYDLIPGQMQYVNMSPVGPTAPTTAQIIGSNKHEASALYGPGDIVFLNKGSNDGLGEGQILDVYIDRTIRDERTPVTYSAVPSGSVKIAKTMPNCSTGVVLSSVDSIQQGDRLQPRVGQAGAGAFLPKGSGAETVAPSEGMDELPDIEETPGSGDDVNMSE